MTARKRPVVEGIEAIETQASSDEGGCDNCAHCGKGDGLIQTHSIIQYGFVADRTSEIYKCQYCQQYSIVNYQTQVVITPQGLQYLEDLKNGN